MSREKKDPRTRSATSGDTIWTTELVIPACCHGDHVFKSTRAPRATL